MRNLLTESFGLGSSPSPLRHPTVTLSATHVHVGSASIARQLQMACNKESRSKEVAKNLTWISWQAEYLQWMAHAVECGQLCILVG